MTAVQTALAWLHAQAATMFATLSAVASNRPEPARQVIVYVLVLVVLAVGIPKLVKVFKK